MDVTEEMLKDIGDSVWRHDIGTVLNKWGIGIDGEGAEVGVHFGEGSENLLSKWTGKKLYSIDCWKHQEPGVYEDIANTPDDVQEKFYLDTVERLSKFGERSKIIRELSVEASKLFTDEQLDFVFLDANHGTVALTEDLSVWYPKVKTGGLIYGDDWAWGSVVDAVKPFFEKIDKKVYIGCWPSQWFVFK